MVLHPALIASIFGGLVGSFLNVVIYRLPNGESIVTPRSRCPKCLTPIPGWLNIPVLSWVLLRGKCYTCKNPIPARYPMVELLTALLWAAVVTRFGLTWASLAGCIFASALVAITFIDIDHWEIPDEISLPGIVLGLIARPLVFDVPWYDGVLGAVAGALLLACVRWFFTWWKGIEAMGLGDLKLIAMTAAFLGLGSILPTLVVGSFAGSIIGGVALLVQRFRKKDAEPEPVPEPVPEPLTGPEAPADEEDDWVPPPTAIPFGPFLALGALAHLLMAPALERLLVVFGEFMAPLLQPIAQLLARLLAGGE